MTLKLVRVIFRGVDNFPTNFGVSGRSGRMGHTHNVTLRPWRLTLEIMAFAGNTGLRAPSENRPTVVGSITS